MIRKNTKQTINKSIHPIFCRQKTPQQQQQQQQQQHVSLGIPMCLTKKTVHLPRVFARSAPLGASSLEALLLLHWEGRIGSHVSCWPPEVSMHKSWWVEKEISILGKILHPGRLTWTIIMEV